MARARNGFEMRLLSPQQEDRIEQVQSFVGEDASGSFGLMAGHARWMTALSFGLARYRIAGEDWRYLALPGGLARFADNRLTITTRRYVIDTDFERIASVLRRELLAEEARQSGVRGSLQTMEQNLLRRLWQLGRERT